MSSKKKGQSKKKSSKKKGAKAVVSKPSFFTRAKENFQKKRLVYTYCLGFLVLVGIFAAIQNSDWFKESLDPILNLYAAISSVILNILGQGTEAIKQTVAGDAFSVNIKQGCDAIAPMLLYFSAVVLYPISFKWKWQGVLGGLFVLFILNIIRIVTLYLSGAYGSMGFFDFMHIEFWQVLYIILTVFVWLIWVRWAGKKQLLANG
jgi:exosortase/archaeosortase family protein